MYMVSGMLMTMIIIYRHLLPKSLVKNETMDFESKLNSGHPIFLYLHGSTGTRFVCYVNLMKVYYFGSIANTHIYDKHFWNLK